MNYLFDSFSGQKYGTAENR